jgi:hypothetical protein
MLRQLHFVGRPLSPIYEEGAEQQQQQERRRRQTAEDSGADGSPPIPAVATDLAALSLERILERDRKGVRMPDQQLNQKQHQQQHHHNLLDAAGVEPPKAAEGPSPRGKPRLLLMGQRR